jgi:hypothetical protein
MFCQPPVKAQFQFLKQKGATDETRIKKPTEANKGNEGDSYPE